MEALSAPPAAPPAEPVAAVPPLETPEAPRATRPWAARSKEPPLTGREVLQYILMFVVGVLITAGTIWFYALFK